MSNQRDQGTEHRIQGTMVTGMNHQRFAVRGFCHCLHLTVSLLYPILCILVPARRISQCGIKALGCFCPSSWGARGKRARRVFPMSPLFVLRG